MSGPSAIEWTERTWNPIVGCSIHSAGCTNCYAMKMAGRLEAMASAHGSAFDGDPGPTGHYLGTTTKTKAGFVWTGKVNVAPDSILMEPLRRKKATTWFVNSMSDLFHESVPDEVIDRVFAVMALCPQHRFQVLTKRADRMRDYITGDRGELRAAITVNSLRLGLGDPRPVAWPLPNVWLGVSVEDQRAADERIPDLLATPAAVRFVSCEPLLGQVDLTWIAEPDDEQDGVIDSLRGRNWIDGFGWGDEMPRWRYADGSTCHRRYVNRNPAIGRLDWVIWGGESGPGARDFALEWGGAIVDQCLRAGVPVFGKQLGARPTFEGRRWHTDDRKGGNPALWPEALRVRELPV
jgi:protein gp37